MKVLGIVLLVIVLIVGGYYAVFGRALRQEADHRAIALALPQALIGGAVRIDERTYFARTPEAFYEAMRAEGFTPGEQMGSAHTFTKGLDSYISGSRMYSAYFMLFTYPERINQNIALR